MSLKEIARFADLSEAQIAASRLRAEGVEVLVQNEYWGGADYLMTIAMGGFRLWAPEAQADEAKALIGALRAGAEPLELEDEAFEPEPEVVASPPSDGVARTGLALVLSLMFGGAAGFLVVNRRRSPAMTVAVVLLLALCALSAAVIAWTWLSYDSGRLTPLS